MRHIVAHDGAAGGHGTMAGARLFAQITSEAKLAETFQEMVRRLIETLGHPQTAGEPLLRAPAASASPKPAS